MFYAHQLTHLEGGRMMISLFNSSNVGFEFNSRFRHAAADHTVLLGVAPRSKNF